MSELMQDPMFFYAIAFFIFLALAVIYGRTPAVTWLDSEIAKIRSELDQAYQLRAEAEAALADCKAKQARAETDAASILNSAKDQVAQMRKKAEEDLAATLARHEHLAAERIHMAEAEAIADVKKAAIDAALVIARKSLEGISDADAQRLVDQAIADIPALKAVRAKAA